MKTLKTLRRSIGIGSPVTEAFTRVEVLVLLGVAGLLLIIVLPVLARDRERASRMQCANNLRQIGLAMQLWGNDRGDLPPWEVPVNQGGTMLHNLGGNAWLHFAWISNELVSPQILLCPADTGRLARDFSSSPDGGFLNPNNRNNSVSYFLSHAFGNGSSVVFAGDRNVQTPGGVGSCSRFPQVSLANVSSFSGWDGNLHNQSGNVVRFDGRVSQYSNDELRDVMRSDPISDRGDQSSLHFLKPR